MEMQIVQWQHLNLRQLPEIVFVRFERMNFLVPELCTLQKPVDGGSNMCANVTEYFVASRAKSLNIETSRKILPLVCRDHGKQVSSLGTEACEKCGLEHGAAALVIE